MRRSKIAVITHVNPFSTGSGQIQRVYNTLLGLAKDWDYLLIYTVDEKRTETQRLQAVLDINSNVTVLYIPEQALTPFKKILFHLLPYLGCGKPSNWSIPYRFKNLNPSDFDDFDIILFEYWHLFKLARNIKKRDKDVVCDTHNILTSSYLEYIETKTFLPGFYKKHLISRYSDLEFSKALGASFDMLIAINKEEEQILKTKFPEKMILYCPMGVDLPPLKESTTKLKGKTESVITYYGGLGNPRNAAAAMQVYNAISELTNQKMAIRYKIVGSNPPAELKDLERTNQNIEVTGFTFDLADAFQNVDLAVIPFKGKFGFRSRIIELMYYKVPVLTTPDAVWGMGFKDGCDILIFENDLLLSQKIKELLSNHELLGRIAGQAYHKVMSEFTFSATYENLSKKLLKCKS